MSVPSPGLAGQTDRMPEILYTLGRAHLEQGEYGEAIEKLTQLLRLSGDTPEVLLDAAIAGIGLNDVTESTQDIYRRAVQSNPEAGALKVSLATLFIRNRVSSPLAIDMCQAALSLGAPAADDIRAYLTQHGYTANERTDGAQTGASSRDATALLQQVEEYWWEGKFSEASSTLEALSENMTVPDSRLKRQRALTRAYELSARGNHSENGEDSDLFASALDNVDPARSMVDLRDFMTLSLALPEAAGENHNSEADFEEYTYILGDGALEDILGIDNGGDEIAQSDTAQASAFDIRKDLLDELSTDPGWQTAEDDETCRSWQSALCLQFRGGAEESGSDRLVRLVGDHLNKTPNILLRKTGNGLISLARAPFAHMDAMCAFLQQLDSLNNSWEETERIQLSAAVHIRNAAQPGDRATLAALADTAHLLCRAEKSRAGDPAAGVLLLLCGSDAMRRARARGLTLVPVESETLSPGKESSYAKVLWRDPMAALAWKGTCRFGRFGVHKRLRTHNGYGTYQATDANLDREVIIKAMPPQASLEVKAQDETREELFGCLRQLGRLSNPNVAKIYDMGEHEDMIYFAREFMDGKPLLEAIDAGERNDEETLNILHTLVRTLNQAARHGIHHLNLKPSNIWLSDYGEVKIADFRVPGFAEDVATSDVLYPGHWRYMAPELLSKEPADERSDIYSVGVIAYEMISGTHPYNTSGSIKAPKDIIKARVAPLSELGEGKPSPWQEWVMKALQSDPGQRYQSLAEMENALRLVQLDLLTQP